MKTKKLFNPEKFYWVVVSPNGGVLVLTIAGSEKMAIYRFLTGFEFMLPGYPAKPWKVWTDAGYYTKKIKISEY